MFDLHCPVCSGGLAESQAELQKDDGRVLIVKSVPVHACCNCDLESLPHGIKKTGEAVHTDGLTSPDLVNVKSLQAWRGDESQVDNRKPEGVRLQHELKGVGYENEWSGQNCETRGGAC